MGSLLKGLAARDRKVIDSWFSDPEDVMRGKILRNTVQEVLRHKRSDHRILALGMCAARIQRGETFEHFASSWHGSGGYLISVGVGHGIMQHPGKPKHGEIGIYIRGRGLKLFPGRKIWQEAKQMLEVRRKGQTSLFL